MKGLNFWADRPSLRIVLMLVFFFSGVALVIGGFRMTGDIVGLALMLVGLVFLLATLFLYNKPFETPKGKREKP